MELCVLAIVLIHPFFVLSHSHSPCRYTVELTFPAEFSPPPDEYEGVVAIRINTTEIVEKVSLNAHSTITIENIEVNEQPVDPSTYNHNKNDDILDVSAKFPITISEIKIKFKGKLSEGYVGLFRGTYEDEGKTKHYLATNFHPTHARRVFPCFDEPEFKAPFHLTIVHPASHKVQFATSTANTNDLGMQVSETFEETHPLSISELGFIIHELQCAEMSDPALLYHVCSRASVADQTKWAQEVGLKILKQLNHDIRVPYEDFKTDHKLDFVAVPEIPSRLFESTGVVLFSEDLLLFDESDSPNKQLVTTSIAKAMAHQWYGGLVSAKDWKDFFVPEAISTYLEYHFSKEMMGLSEWKLDQQFVTSAMQVAMEMDDMKAEPLSSFHLDDDLREDTHRKYKGASLIRTFSLMVGEDSFHNFLRHVIEALKFKTIHTLYLWTLLETQLNKIKTLSCGITVDVAMRNYVAKQGYPVVNVIRNGNQVTVTQEGNFEATGGDGTTWYVPLTYETSDGDKSFASTLPVAWLSPRKPSKNFLVNENAWVIFNTQQLGYYRVNYDEQEWQRISTALNTDSFDGIHTLNRAQIVDDVFSFAKLGRKGFKFVFEVIEFLRRDVAYSPWVPAFRGFEYLLKRVPPEESELREKIEKFVLSLMDALGKKYPMTTTVSDSDILLQRLAWKWSCRLKAKECVDQAQTIYESYMSSNTKPDKYIRDIVYCNALANKVDKPAWEFLLNEYPKSKSEVEKKTIISALGCSPDSEILKGYLMMMLASDAKITSKNDQLSILPAVYKGSPQGLEEALTFVVDKAQDLLQKYGETGMYAVLNDMPGWFNTNGQIDKMASSTWTSDSLKASLETAKENVKWFNSPMVKDEVSQAV
ncbi:aminopeptidase N-like [Cylas formicarius]|uniref:aminopeptidase N-like n=1 Tax=Cylas formicarius TaxID=197179 RepID=UPI002958C287|nr:aminopeptidase N-like [Cylas formicarius]